MLDYHLNLECSNFSQLSGGNSGPLEPKPLDHSIPPGAHFDLYRAVANPTRQQDIYYTLYASSLRNS